MRSEKHRRFERIYSGYKNDVLKLSIVYLGDYQLAEDAVQETFFKVLKKLNTLKDDSKLKPWLFQIAVNVCRSALSHKSRREVPAENVVKSSPAQNDLDEKLAVIEEIGKLKPELREVILLFYYQELSRSEIAYVLNIPETTVDYRLRAAKSELKKNLGEEEDYE